MDKESLISAISMEFGLSREQSEIIVSSIFMVIAQSLRKNKDLEIQKFGKFKLIPDKDAEKIIKFAPSKKLSLRVNSNFEELRKVKIRSDYFRIDDAEEYTIPEAQTDTKSDMLQHMVDDLINEKDDIIITEVPRKLISDDLIKLHKEITKEEENEPSKTNLWG